MKTADFCYDLPPELIAQTPAPQRAQARMMVVSKDHQSIQHKKAADLPTVLRRGDLLVLNNTKVIPARLTGHKQKTGGRIEVLLLEEAAPSEWFALWQSSRPPRVGQVLELAQGQIQAVVLAEPQDGTLRLQLRSQSNLMQILEELGTPPLPPYIKRKRSQALPEDRQRYQTVFASCPGAVAAPTAGLHFTPELLAELAGQGIENVKVTLHVGVGTFRPVTCENVADHRMEAERYSVFPEAAAAINAAKGDGRRVIAVGSTVTRTLETVVGEDGRVSAGSGRSSLFIVPPYEFRVVDGLLTNFHLPASTLLMMISAFAGLENVKQWYETAVRERYRFYSYGDCMLIL